MIKGFFFLHVIFCKTALTSTALISVLITVHIRAQIEVAASK